METINLDKLLTFSADMICTIDHDGTFVAVSAASETILGFRPEELSGHHYQEFIYPADLDAAKAAMEDITINGSAIQLQNRYVHKDGKIIPLDWTARCDKQDHLLYCIARSGTLTLQALDLRNSLEESLQRYSYVTKATSDAIWDWDLDEGTLFWGEGFEAIFGYDPALVPRGIASWTMQIHPEDLTYVERSVEQVLHSKETNWKAEYRYRKADGEYAEVVDRGFVIRDHQGKAIRMVGAMHDISERKRGLAEMKRISDDLYRRNSELQQFAYIVSHNLRSPVANIMGIASLLEMDRDDPETVAHCTFDLKTSIGRLNEVINDLSLIVSLSAPAGKLPLETVDLTALADDIRTDLADTLAQNAASLTGPEQQVTINTHKAYLYSIFHNLVSNALKYHSDKAPVISIHAHEEGAEVIIEIGDNGQGIDLERYGEQLFKPYKRFHGGKDGKGLGLFLVKSHVELLGGTIDVESSPGAGTRFMIRLPLNR